MFSLVLCIRLTGDEDFSSLIAMTKENAKSKKLMDLSETDIFPGTYEGDQYSYTVSKRITGDQSNCVSGYAFENDYIGIIKSSVKSAQDDRIIPTVFIDSEKEVVYAIDYLLTEDGVKIYKAKEISIFEAIDSITLSSNQRNPNDEPGKGLNKSLNINWNEGEKDPFVDGKPKIFENLSGPSHKIGAGFYGNAKVTIGFKSKGFKDVTLSCLLEIKCIIGVTVDINNPSKKFNDTLIENCSHIFTHKPSVTVLGFTISLETGVFASFWLKNIALKLRCVWKLDKSYLFSFTKQLSISSTSGFKCPDAVIKYEPISKAQVLQYFKNILQDTSVSFEFTPELNFGVNLSLLINKNNVAQSDYYFTAYCPFEFSLNITKCPAPYLSGHITPILNRTIKFNGLKLAGYQVVDEHNNTDTVYKPKEVDICLFDPKNYDDDASTSAATKPKSNSSVLAARIKADGLTEKDTDISVLMHVDHNDKLYFNSYLPALKLSGDSQYESAKKKIFIQEPLTDYNLSFKAKQNGAETAFFTKDIALKDFKYDEKVNEEYKMVNGDANYRLLFTRKIAGDIGTDAGKEFKNSNEFYFCFIGSKKQSYKVIYRNASSEYVADMTNKLYSDSIIDEEDEESKWIGQATIDGCYVEVSIQQITFSDDSEETEIPIMRIQGENSVRISTLVIPKHEGVGRFKASDLKLDEWKVKAHLDDDEKLMISFDEKSYTFGSDDIVDKKAYEFPFSVGEFTIIFIAKEYSPKILAQIHEGAVSTIIAHNVEVELSNSASVKSVDVIGNDPYITATIVLKQSITTIPSTGIYIPLQIDGYFPIIDCDQIEADFFIIKLTENMISNEKYVTIPCRNIFESSTNAHEMRVYPFLYGNLDGLYMYDPTKLISVETEYTNVYAGCLYKGSSFSMKMVSKTSQKSAVSLEVSAADNEYTLFYINVDKSLYPIQFVEPTIHIPADTLYGSFDSSVIIMDDFNFKFRIECDRGTTADVKMLSSTGEEIGSESGVSTFTVNQKCIYQVYPICTSNESSYCIFDYNIPVGKTYLVKYGSEDTLNNMATDHVFTKCILSELFTPTQSYRVYKTWEGQVIYKEFDLNNWKIEVDILKKPDTVEFSFKNNGEGFTYSGANVFDKPEKALKYLGVEEQQYSAEMALFNADGSITVKSSYIKGDVLDSNFINLDDKETIEGLSWILGLSNGTKENFNIVASEYKEPEPEKQKKSKLSGGAIAGIVIGCVVAVAAIVAAILFFVFRCNDKEE